MAESIKKTGQASPDKKWDPISKRTRAKFLNDF
jgi:hypothetical protein